MDIQISIIITSFQRAHLLKWNLFSLSKQSIQYEFETIVLNDGINDDTEAVCKDYEKQLNLKYVFTGQRNLSGEIKWRVPGFAYNIGTKLSSGDILVLSCAEMFHINDTINSLAQYPLSNPKFMGIPIGRDDRDGSFLRYLEENDGNVSNFTNYAQYAPLNTKLPFLMTISRDEFFAIGGYDEDFTGLAWDDNDLISRLSQNGCRLKNTSAKTMHLYHPRFVIGKGNTPEFIFNQKLYQERKKQIIRNEGREWGVLKP